MRGSGRGKVRKMRHSCAIFSSGLSRTLKRRVDRPTVGQPRRAFLPRRNRYVPPSPRAPSRVHDRGAAMDCFLDAKLASSDPPALEDLQHAMAADEPASRDPAPSDASRSGRLRCTVSFPGARTQGSPRAFRATAPTPPRTRRPRRGLRRGVQGASLAPSRPRRASERRAPRSPSLGVSVLSVLNPLPESIERS